VKFANGFTQVRLGLDRIWQLACTVKARKVKRLYTTSYSKKFSRLIAGIEAMLPRIQRVETLHRWPTCDLPVIQLGAAHPSFPSPLTPVSLPSMHALALADRWPVAMATDNTCHLFPGAPPRPLRRESEPFGRFRKSSIVSGRAGRFPLQGSRTSVFGAQSRDSAITDATSAKR